MHSRSDHYTSPVQHFLPRCAPPSSRRRRPNVGATPMSLPPSRKPQDNTTASPTPPPTGSSSTRSPQPAWSGISSSHTPRRGLAPITTSAAGGRRPGSAHESPSRGGPFSPTGSSINQAPIAPNRQVTSRHSSVSSVTSYSPAASGHHVSGTLHSGQRSRAPTSTGSPRLASSIASLSSLSQGASTGLAGGGTSSRFARHSPSLSTSTVGSPVSSAGGPGQLTSLVITQLNILLSTIKENNFDTQAEKIRRLIDEHGMAVFEPYFRRALNNSWSLVFPGDSRPGANNAESLQLVRQEMEKIGKNPQQAAEIAQALDSPDWDINLPVLITSVRLDPVSRVAFLLACRATTKSDLRMKGKRSTRSS